MIYQNLIKRKNNIKETKDVFNISFMEGPRVDIEGYSDKKYQVDFIDRDIIRYSVELSVGRFAMPSKKYHGEWNIRISENGDIIADVKYDPRWKNVYFDIDSSSIGDTICWIGQIERFFVKYKCKVIIKTFHNDLFSGLYPDWTWIKPGQMIGNHYSSYKLGYFLGENKFEFTPKDPRECALGETASLIMGMEYIEYRPRGIYMPNQKRPIDEKYVCICTESTAGAKFWHRENGWQDVVDYLNSSGYKVVVLQKNKSLLNNVVEYSGESMLSLSDAANMINHSAIFIGIGSGLSWMAWALKKKVVLISGFSKKWAEFQLDCDRIINESVCHGCWNNKNFTFDKGDWWWCPVNKGNDDHFICTKSINSQHIIERINFQLGILDI